MASKIQVRRDTSDNWSSVNPILAQGEYGLNLDSGKVKCGDGITAWNDLDYCSPSQAEFNEHKAENLYHWAQGVNDLVITTGGDFQYVEGAIIRFGTSNTNTGAVTLNVDGKGARPLIHPVTYAELPPGRLKQYQYYEAIYNSGWDCFFIKDASVTSVKDASVTYVNEETGDVVLTAEDVGAETPAGAQSKVDAHAALTSAHSATSAATANRIMMRDANGRAKVAAPSAADDIARKDTVDAVQTNLNVHANTSATISVSGHVNHAVLTATLDTTWSGTSAPYTKTVSVSGILSTDTPIIDVVMSGTYSTDTAIAEAWGYIYRAVTADGSITFYATEKPTVSLPIQIRVVR
jgi:hypothetical protein